MRNFLILSSAVVLMLCIGSAKDFSTAPPTMAPRSMAYIVPPMVQVQTAPVDYLTTEVPGYPAPATTVAVRPQQSNGQAWRLTHAARSNC